MPKLCAIALTLICLIATVADTPGVSLSSGPAMMDEPPAATAPLEVVGWPHVLLASDSTIAHPVEHATWAPLAMNAADALELEPAHAQDVASVSEEFASGSVGGPNYDHPTLSFRFGTSMRGRTSNVPGGGSRGPTGNTGTDSGSTEAPPADGGPPAQSDDQPSAGSAAPESPPSAPPSNTETSPGDTPPSDHGDPSPPANEPATPEVPPADDDGSTPPGEEPREEPNDTPTTPTYPSHPIEDGPGHGTPIQVPEPSSLGLLGIGLAGLFARRRRRANCS